MQQPFDGPLRWQIPSDSEEYPHLVDLGGYGGRGECSCMDWRTRHGPVVKAGGWETCKHIERAELLLGRWAYRQLGMPPPPRSDCIAFGRWLRMNWKQHHEAEVPTGP